jgi:hypothetical protein
MTSRMVLRSKVAFALTLLHHSISIFSENAVHTFTLSVWCTFAPKLKDNQGYFLGSALSPV